MMHFPRNSSIRNALCLYPALVGAVGVVLWLTLPALPQERVDNAIVLAVDVSSSMDVGEKRIARESHAYAIVSSEVLTAIFSGPYRRSAFAYVEFGDRAEVIVDWTIIDTPASAEAFSAAILSRGGKSNLGSMTGIGSALVVAAELFERAPFEPLFRTVDVAGDGRGNQPPHLAVPRSILVDDGVTINGLPMTLRPDNPSIVDYYASEVIGGPRAFSIELRDINDMPLLVRRKLVMELG